MKRLALTVLLSIAMLVGLIAFARAQGYGPVIMVEYSTDRQGADIRSFPVSQFGECMDECAFSSGCRALTWVNVNQQPPDYNNSSSLCWLKNSVPGRRANRGMISGVKQ
jgi:PAN domain